jgi:hypothetical protein
VTTPYPGVTHTVYVDAAAPLRIHVVAIDVSSQEILLSATQAADRGQTVSDWADCKRGTAGCVTSDIAINGDLFSPSGFVPAGLAIGSTKAWPDAATDNAIEGWLGFGRPNDVSKLYLSSPPLVEMPSADLHVEGVVGGRAQLVSSGTVMTEYNDNDPTEPFRRAPRSAVGLSAADTNGLIHTLYLAVVDGDQKNSSGMTAEELGSFLASIGVVDALELDGGGSSALYLRKEGGIVNAPSDGVERQVANHLGVKYGSLPSLDITGFICNELDFGQCDQKAINNATVTVDGKASTWNTGHLRYTVTGVTPHFVCAHAAAPNFQTGVQCREIREQDTLTGNLAYLSVPLRACPTGQTQCDPPPDMATPLDMAMPHRRPADLAVPVGTTDGGSVHVGGAHGGCALVTVRHDERAETTSIIIVFVLFLGAARTCRRCV